RLQRPAGLPPRNCRALPPVRPRARGGAADPLPADDRDGSRRERRRDARAAARDLCLRRRRARPRLARPRPEPGRDAACARGALRRRPSGARAWRAAADAARARGRGVRSRPVNVLFLTTNYPRPESPIDGIFVREHARAAAEIADVRVVHLLRAPAARGLVRLERIAGEEPPAWRVPYRRFGKPLAQLAFVLGPVALARRFRREGWVPDVVHAHSFLSALPARLLGRLLRRPVAYTEHWTIFLPENPGSLSRGMERLARFALEHADVVLPVSEDLDRALRRLAPGARTWVVPNVVDEVFTPADGRPLGGRGRGWPGGGVGPTASCSRAGTRTTRASCSRRWRAGCRSSRRGWEESPSSSTRRPVGWPSRSTRRASRPRSRTRSRPTSTERRSRRALRRPSARP